CLGCSRWPCVRVSARMPECTRGCKVFTRPSRTSGKPVSCSTSMTGTPASAIFFAVEPVETISTPTACKPCASSSRPVLSYTLTRARRMGLRSPVACAGFLEFESSVIAADLGLSSLDGESVSCDLVQDLHDQTPLHVLNFFVQRLHFIAWVHVYRFLRHDRAGINPGVHHVHGRAGDFHAVFDSVHDRLCTRERGQQRGVGGDDATWEAIHDCRADDAHNPGGDDEVSVPAFQRRNEVAESWDADLIVSAG